MRLLHDRYAVHGDRGCDLVTGEVLPLAELERDEGPIPSARPDADPLGPMAELFDQGREASPRWVVAQARGAQSRLLQRRVAALARTRGYVPIAVSSFHRLRVLLEADLRDRALLLVGSVGDGLDTARDALLAAASWSPRPHLLLTFAAPERHRLRLASVVREARAVYGARVPQPLPASVAAGVEPHLQRALKAREFVRAGRHAAAERLLRDVAGALERRRAFEPAARVIEMLVTLLMDRGRLDPADAACREAQRMAGLAASESGARRARALEACVRIEQARLTEAEGLLRALLVTSGEAAMPPVALAALSRCLCLQGRFDEVLAVPVPGTGGGVADAVAADVAEARVSALVATGRLFEAGLLAREAVDAASGDPRAGVIAQCALLRARCAAGDLALAASTVEHTITLARHAHVPFLAVRARLTWLETLHRAGRVREAREQSVRLRRVQRVCSPQLRRAIATAIEAQAATPRLPASGAATPPLAPLLVRLVNDEEDDQRALTQVMERLAMTLAAGRIDLVSADAGPVSVLLTRGTGLPTSIAGRLMESGIPIGPEGEGREAGVPVRLGARLLGALACRWPLDRAIPPDAGPSLELAAAVMAPRLEVMQHKARDASHASLLVPELVGASAAMEEVRRAIARAARAPFSVLIEGESGTGKELVARAIHSLGPRRERRFCDVNCAALPDELLESELFGHTRGAFTGAVVDRPGLFEDASGGTLFMDEVAELSARAQAKLLRVVQQQEVRRVGETFSRPIDVRLIAAANRPLAAEAEAGRFRQDLLYRLDVIRVSLPPLRDRPGDAALLAARFWEVAAERVGSRARLAPSLLAELARYHWPGNVRELQNVMSALAVAAPPRGQVGPALLPPAISRAAAGQPPRRLAAARAEFERRFVEAAMAHCGGSHVRAARALGLSRQGLVKVLGRLGLTAAASRSAE